MDRKTLFAIALCVAFLLFYPMLLRWIGLDRYLRPSTPPGPRAVVDSTRHDTTAAVVAPVSVPPSATAVKPGPALPLHPTEPQLLRTIQIETPLYRAVFSNRGARLESVELKHYASAHGISSAEGRRVRHRPGEPYPPGDRVVLAGGPSFAMDLGSGANLRPLGDLIYAVAESLDASGSVRALAFTARDSGGLLIRQTWRVRPDDYALDLEIEVRSVPLAWRLSDYSLSTRSWPLLEEQDPVAEEHALRVSSLVGTNLHREVAGGLRKGPKLFDGNVVWAAIQTRYFMGLVSVRNGSSKSAIAQAEQRTLPAAVLEQLPKGAPATQSIAISSLVMGLPGETNPVDHFLVYFGPAEYQRLARFGHGLERAVDLGWNWIRPFSHVLLLLLTWIYRVCRNYGLAIIVLATLVRVLLHPLNLMSMRSMRAMQRLQPELERLKQKYKDDAQAMNQAVMGLYKENKVNPAGGCLPMLLQMPLFIALYSVLYNAIELRQAPFVAWIQDLSAPDTLLYAGPFPIRLLPLLMAASGLLTQKLTPTDPRQVNSMYIMNIVMVVFFYNLPSGLVLYWTVMNLLTALQQWLILREDGSAAVVVVPERGAVARKAGRK